jgi:transposase
MSARRIGSRTLGYTDAEGAKEWMPLGSPLPGARTSVHDGSGSYQGYTFTQALCNVHHLRELTFVEEELKQIWARKMKDLLIEMKGEVEQARSAGKSELDLLVLVRLLRRYDEILVEGYQANPPPEPKPERGPGYKRKPGKLKQSPARNLLDRLSQQKWAVLRFLHDFAVPFDNDVIAYCTPSA